MSFFVQLNYLSMQKIFINVQKSYDNNSTPYITKSKIISVPEDH